MGRLLLAEDNLINQRVAVAMLSNAGYRVDTVLNGAVAVQAVAAQPYDAILMDCQMPELNGYEATAAIRAYEGSARRTPIIAMTASARPEDRKRCLAAGMDSYLAKPFSKDALLALVSRSVRNGASMTTALPGAEQASATEISIDVHVLDELRILGGTDEQGFLAELVDQFVRDTEPRLVRLHEALELGDALGVGRIAHSIRGSSSQLGGRRLAQACTALEKTANASSLSDGQIDLQQVETDYQDLRRTLEHLSLADQQGLRGLRA